MRSEYRKVAILILLLVPCIWLVRRNLFPPTSPSTANASSTVDSSLTDPTQASGAGTARRSSAAGPAQQPLEFDSTLRLDLLEASRSVEYQGNSRNIFEFYTPPPPPPPVESAPPLPTENSSTGTTPKPPSPPTVPFKFYGTAQREGSPKRAFLTDGEEIMIAQEGDVVANFYKINRIGVSSLELEDTRTQQIQQLPLIEE